MSSPGQQPPDLSKLRILVVEDEMMLMMLIEDALADAGCRPLIASRIPKAVALSETEAIDCAILDVNLAGEDVYPVADVLSRRDIPLSFRRATARTASRHSTVTGQYSQSHMFPSRSHARSWRP
jgi:DNA-binding response OmpR family regulator